MAGIGLSKPVFALYHNAGTTITYSDYGVLGKAVEFSLELNDGSSNILYADNGPAESDNQFSGGTLNFTTDDLLPAAVSKITGVALTAVTNSGIVDTTTPKEMIFDDDQVIPYCGVGIIVKKKQGGAIKWVGVVFPKVQFSNPGLSATTQGESIEWNTPEISAIILRDDSTKHSWYRASTPLDSEADAAAYIGGILNPTPATT